MGNDPGAKTLIPFKDHVPTDFITSQYHPPPKGFASSTPHIRDQYKVMEHEPWETKQSQSTLLALRTLGHDLSKSSESGPTCFPRN